MTRTIIHIDGDKCNGCGACVSACHERAIGMVDGRAKLLRDDYCDGLGDCLPACPMGAITFEEREAAAYDAAAVMEKKRENHIPCGCPGSQAPKIIPRAEENALEYPVSSQLAQWPVQIKLAPIQAPYFDGADLLIAADCTAYAYANFHREFMRGKVTLIGCPKLDGVDYSEKLAEVIRRNAVASLTVLRMEVPCCGGLEHAAVTALNASGKTIACRVATISVDGKLLSE